MALFSQFRLGASEEKSSDSSSEWSEDVSSLVGLRQHEQLCQVTGSVSEVDGDTRRLARRKLLIACGISLIFMMGEVIGERESVRRCLTKVLKKMNASTINRFFFFFKSVYSDTQPPSWYDA